jgi:hypothetical protein
VRIVNFAGNQEVVDDSRDPLTAKPYHMVKARFLTTAECRKNVDEIIKSPSFDREAFCKTRNGNSLLHVAIQFVDEHCQAMPQVRLANKSGLGPSATTVGGGMHSLSGITGTE